METTTPAPQTAPSPTPVIRLTERALAQVKDVMKANQLEGFYFSVRVVPAGCSGLGYELNLARDRQASDLVWEQDGVRIATDPLSSKYLAGTEVDFVSGLQGEGFKFNNPNAKSTCGCGSSFTA